MALIVWLSEPISKQTFWSHLYSGLVNMIAFQTNRINCIALVINDCLLGGKKTKSDWLEWISPGTVKGSQMESNN